MKFCTFCGNKININAKFCNHCGERLGNAKEIKHQPKTKSIGPISKSMVPAIFIGVIFIGIISVIVIFLGQRSSTREGEN